MNFKGLIISVNSSSTTNFKLSNRLEPYYQAIAVFSNSNPLLKRIVKNQYSNPILYNNLVLVESSLPEILGHIYLKNKYISMTNALQLLIDKNPLKINTTVKELFYKSVLKKLLFALFTGMNENEVWSGSYKVVGLTIAVYRNNMKGYLTLY